jgi:hypothetical protein
MTMATGESHEMTLPTVVKTRQSPSHEENLLRSFPSICDL